MSTLYRTAQAFFCVCAMISPPLQAAQEQPPAAEAPPAPQALQPPLPERSQTQAQALERLLPKAEQQMLQAGEESFLALWKPANTSEPQGVLVIVPGAGETADWPTTVGPLRRKFPDVGWHTLSLSLPDLLTDAPQARAPTPTTPAAAPGESAPAKDTPADANANVAQATAAQADVADSTDAVDASDSSDQADAARIFARLDAALAFAEQQGTRSIVLLGHGSGAYWAARYLSERQPAQVRKLVMISAQTPARVEHDLEALAPTLKVPTADIYYATREQDRRAAQQRLQASKRQKDSQYRQLLLIAMPGNTAAEQEQLLRRVRGWLSPQGSN